MNDVSARLAGALESRYLIERQLGEGGMATVYLAHDLRHDRKVALKVLRPELAAVVGAERFLAEIRTTANLQHPHILPLFGSGEADGLLFYVMPYVEGKSLAERLGREKQLPVAEAVRIASAVANALDYAHRRGVIHRDIKPANILFQDAQPVVADFGIALAVGAAGGARLTDTGLSLGTPYYMSPEQATGEQNVGPSTDIYALGCVLYEMLVGEPPFTGKTAQAVLGKILTERLIPPLRQRPSVPANVDAAVRRALEKIPADRFQSASELGSALTNPAFGHGKRTRRGPERLKSWNSLSVAVAGALAASLVLIAWPHTDAAAGPAQLFEITFPSDVTLQDLPVSPDLAMSRDGSLLAFDGAAGASLGIYLRPLSGTESRRVAGTETGVGPEFSPRGNWLLFNANGQLRKVPTTGGTPVLVADSIDNYGWSWGDGDVVLFTRRGTLWSASANGGSEVELAQPDSARGRLAYRWPHLLPGGKAALVTVWKGALDNAELAVVELESGVANDLGVVGTHPRFVPPGYLIFARARGTILAAPLSLRRLRVTGAPVIIREGARVKAQGAADLAISHAGTLVFRTAERGERRLVAVGRDGGARSLVETSATFISPRVSPDGRQIAVGTSGPADIWVHDLLSRTHTRLTTDGGARPEWTPDGRRIAFTAPVTRNSVRWQTADFSGAAESYLEADAIFEVSFGGAWTATRRGESDRDIWLAPFDAPHASRPFINTPASEENPRISPDGSLLAYVTDRADRREVYVTPLPGPGPQVQVSTEGGVEPVWSRDGAELFYRGPTHLLAARIARSPQLIVSRRDTLFQDIYMREPGYGRANYDALNDSELVMIDGGGPPPPIFALVNWTEVLASQTRVPER